MSGLTQELRPEDGAVKSLNGKVREVISVGGACHWSVLEVFDALGILNLSIYRSGKCFRYVLEIDAAPEATRP